MKSNKDSGRVQDKIAVITGAARGIGRAAAIALAREGAHIIGIDIAGPVSPNFELEPAATSDLEETGRAVQEAGRRWLSIRLDVRNMAELRDAAEQIKRESGGLDIVFANAGIQGFKPLLEMEDADWHEQIEVNLTGTANTLRAFAPLLVERGGGRIIVTSSTQGRHGTKNGSSYSASKWGIIGLMKSAALELGEYNITVNALIPGLVNTPLTRRQQRYAQAIQAGGNKPTGNAKKDEEDAKKTLLKKTPLGVPWIEPEAIAPAVVFLASDEAAMVSGATIDVTGGDSANNT
ncbi:SDR family oxidoreductase [Pontibacter sp. BT731]|uniref:SDR family NAD(P)-dependent oxidoreductase n=1 Tax=Pontibacter coccineus TaxID=3063328 RepID=UPI0026E2062D|nr:SDR family NAD(P)-dependent oxidoreductase [Pontibacter sp. BT731]MDO6388590.1 SDR family oxidoreductase [Pontibacter sp. BT731]